MMIPATGGPHNGSSQTKLSLLQRCLSLLQHPFGSRHLRFGGIELVFRFQKCRFLTHLLFVAFLFQLVCFFVLLFSAERAEAKSAFAAVTAAIA
ncbi:MAG: hypothetical protein KatS3mg105_0102 [Gemmatales bacterium]|nr:MAG: hypothetical protein KatS3mg105_0102 [Gemmatales bacterium]